MVPTGSGAGSIRTGNDGAQRYFSLVAAGPHTEPERLALLEGHRDEIRSRLASLETALATIEFKIAHYGGALGSHNSDCSA